MKGYNLGGTERLWQYRLALDKGLSVSGGQDCLNSVTLQHFSVIADKTKSLFGAEFYPPAKNSAIGRQ